jgi:hypothetical protein
LGSLRDLSINRNRQKLCFILCFDYRLAPASHWCNTDTKVFLFYILHVTYIWYSSRITLRIKIKLYHNLLNSFKDLSKHRERQREVTLDYDLDYVLTYLYLHIYKDGDGLTICHVSVFLIDHFGETCCLCYPFGYKTLEECLYL